MLLLVACGDSQPLPDIDATVEARVELAKASLVAPTAAPLPTHTPLPTYTPVPAPAVRPTPTPTSTATATPIVPKPFLNNDNWEEVLAVLQRDDEISDETKARFEQGYVGAEVELTGVVSEGHSAWQPFCLNTQSQYCRTSATMGHI